MSQQINLYNPIFLKQKKIFSALAMLKALGLILLGCAALAWYGSGRVAALDVEAVATRAQLNVKQARLLSVNQAFPARQANRDIEAEIASSQTELDLLRQASAVLQKGEFGNAQGYSEYFRAFARASVAGLWLTGVSITGAGTPLVLQGKALEADLIPVYINRLAKETVLQGKSFGSLEIFQPRPKGEGAATEVARTGAGRASLLEFSLQSHQADAPGAPGK